MRYSQTIAKTKKETPKDAIIVSHQYLVRAGFIYQLAAGLYEFLPLGFRVLTKVDQIIKEELAKKGVEHLLMPLVHPAALWRETGRYDKVDVLLKFTTRAGQECVLAPTHEETITDIARKYISTYKDLPLILNQNQWKYRDEIRATGGLLRTREFLMQDAYSFDRDKKGLDESFKKISLAYYEIFKRIGLKVEVVKADSGTIGGSDSEEFMVVADAGEDSVFVCDKCDYKANKEKCESIFETYKQDKEMKPMKKVKGEKIIGVDELVKFLGVDIKQTTKTLFFLADNKFVAAMVRGDYSISETKLKNYLKCTNLFLASEEDVKDVTGAEIGYAGPVNLPKDIKVIADITCKDRVNFEAGANETGYHNLNVNFERDFPTPVFVDIRESKEGDICPKCKKGKLMEKNAIELGHVFKLGTVYSKSMGANFTDVDGQAKPMEMGCYGIGISRLVAAIVEASHDEKGIIWPKNVAPFLVHMISLGAEKEVTKEAEKVYKDLIDANVEVLYDDRDESAGKKFADADLIGIPLRLVVSKRSLENGGVEWKERGDKDFSSEKSVVKIKDLKKKIENFIAG